VARYTGTHMLFQAAYRQRQHNPTRRQVASITAGRQAWRKRHRNQQAGICVQRQKAKRHRHGENPGE